MSNTSFDISKLLEERLTSEEFAKNQRIYADFVAKYYGDPDFRAKVDANPTVALKAEGLYIPDGAKVKLLFNEGKVIHIVLPGPAT